MAAEPTYSPCQETSTIRFGLSELVQTSLKIAGPCNCTAEWEKAHSAKQQPREQGSTKSTLCNQNKLIVTTILGTFSVRGPDRNGAEWKETEPYPRTSSCGYSALHPGWIDSCWEQLLTAIENSAFLPISTSLFEWHLQYLCLWQHSNFQEQIPDIKWRYCRRSHFLFVLLHILFCCF